MDRLEDSILTAFQSAIANDTQIAFTMAC